MDINNLIKQAHKTAIEKGFYDCPECDGDGRYYCFNCNHDCDNDNGCPEPICKSCNGTRKKDRDISELIVLIIRELYEALEAHRSGKFADMKNYKEDLSEDGIDSFFIHIKDTLEDELADVLIRLFDTMGYLGFEYNKDYADTVSITIEPTFFKNILILNEMLIEICALLVEKHELANVIIIKFIDHMMCFCNHQNIDIETHINLKMEYNKTREYKHGKRY